MALAHVQDSALALMSGEASDSASISPTAGNALIVGIAQATATVGNTFSVSDNIDGTTGWTQVITLSGGNSRMVEIWVKPNVPSGINTVTVTQTSGANLSFVVSEFSGFGSSINVDDSDGYSDEASENTHESTDVGVSSANECLAFSVGRLIGNATENNPGTGYTEAPAGLSNSGTIYQWQIFPSGVSNEFGVWTNTGTARDSIGVIALLSAGGGGGEPAPTRGQVSFAELEVPFVGTRGRVSFAELEVPTAPTRGRLSFAELEVPTAPTRGRLSFAEVEVPSTTPDPTRGLVSYLDFETPNAPTRGLLSWIEFALLDEVLTTEDFHSFDRLSSRRRSPTSRLNF